MTDSKTAIERLREMLDALGVRYEKSEDDVIVYYDEGKRYTYSANPESGWAQLFGYHLTPEQAIAATVGETCTMTLLPDEQTEYIQPMRCTACGHKTYAQLASYCPHCGKAVKR